VEVTPGPERGTKMSSSPDVQQTQDRFIKFNQRVVDAISDMTANQIKAYLQCLLLCRRPYAGDRTRGWPATPDDKVGLVTDRGRRITYERLARSCGVPRRRFGTVVDDLVELGRLEITDGGIVRVLNVEYLIGDSDDDGYDGAVSSGTTDRGTRPRGPQGRYVPSEGEHLHPSDPASEAGGHGPSLPQDGAVDVASRWGRDGSSLPQKGADTNCRSASKGGIDGDEFA